MNLKNTIWTACVIFTVLILGVGVMFWFNADNEQTDAFRSFDILMQEVGEREASIRNLNVYRESLKLEVTALESEWQTLSGELEKLGGQFSEKEKELEARRQRIAELDAIVAGLEGR